MLPLTWRPCRHTAAAAGERFVHGSPAHEAAEGGHESHATSSLEGIDMQMMWGLLGPTVAVFFVLFQRPLRDQEFSLT
eukprot:1138135-Pelagomonas_calceolata.AAC.3